MSEEEQAPESTASPRKQRPYVWSFVQQGAEQIVYLGVSIFLARLLTPADFGLVAMVSVVTGFAGILVDLGIGSALIHKQETTSTDLATAFWANLALGTVLAGALFFAAPLIAKFYDQPALISMTRLLSLNFVFGAITVVDTAMLRKRLEIRALARASVISSGFAGVVGISLAAWGAGAMALVVQTLSRALVNAVLLRAATAFVPRASFSTHSLREMLRYGLGIIGANAVNYWARNADKLVVGKWLGSADLGFYNRAYSLMTLPMNSISRVVSGVLFPVLAQKSHSLDEMREEFVRTTSRVAFFTFPIMVGMGCCAPSLIRTMFGERWIECAWILQMFTPLGVYQTIVGLYGPIYLALGRTTLDFKWSLLLESVLIAGIVIGLATGRGILGLILGLYAGVALNFVPTNLIPLRLLELPLWHFIRALLPAFGASLVMGLAVVALELNLTHVAAPLLLAADVAMGAIVYTAICLLLRIPAALHLRDGVLAALRRAPAFGRRDAAPRL